MDDNDNNNDKDKKYVNQEKTIIYNSQISPRNDKNQKKILSSSSSSSSISSISISPKFSSTNKNMNENENEKNVEKVKDDEDEDDDDEDEDEYKFQYNEYSMICKMICPMFYWTFEYLTRFIFKGVQKPHKSHKNLPELEEIDKVQYQMKKFEKVWNWEMMKKRGKKIVKYRLLISFIMMFGLDICRTCGMYVIGVTIKVFIPFLMGYLLKSLNPLVSDEIRESFEEAKRILPNEINPEYLGIDINKIYGFRKNNYEAWMWIIIIFVSFVVSLILVQNAILLSVKIGIRMSSILWQKIYEKGFLLSNKSKSMYPNGMILNVVSIDIDRLSRIVEHSLYGIIDVFVSVVPSCVILFIKLGISMVPSIIIILSLFPLSFLLSFIGYRLEKRSLKIKDERVKILNEFVQGIKVIKLYCWENEYLKKIEKIRKKELLLNIIQKIIRSVSYSLLTLSPVLMSFCSFSWLFYASNGNLDSAVLFSSAVYFEVIQYPFGWAVMTFNTIVESTLSFNRINKFLQAEEIVKQKRFNNFDTPIILENCEFVWESFDSNGEQKKKKKITDIGIKEEIELKETVFDGHLKDINISLPKGSLTMVVGSVGNGKTSLLRAMLNEMKKIKGEMKISGSISYVGQIPFILNQSIMDNILYGKEKDQEKINYIVQICSLVEDLNVLKDGIETEIGERGINLSGGQKARISFARSLYSDSDIYLLDDILSAVDSHVGKSIFEKGIMGYLNKKTRILTTNNLSYLNQSDQILLIENGMIVEMGKYNELMEKKEKLYNLVENYSIKEREENNQKVLDIIINNEEEELSSLSKEEERFKLVKKEDKKRGLISVISIFQYFNTIGKLVTIIVLFIYIISQFLYTSNQWFLGELTKGTYGKKYGSFYNTSIFFNTSACSNSTYLNGDVEYTNECVKYFNNSNNESCPVNYICEYKSVDIFWIQGYQNLDYVVQNGLNVFYLIVIYLAISMGYILLQFLRELCFQICSIKAAIKIHDSALKRLSRSPLSFFGSTPSGRIINRFGMDVLNIDKNLPSYLQYLLNSIFQSFGIIFLVSIISYGLYIILVVPVLVIFFFVFYVYRKNCIELVRISVAAKSPCFTHVSETLNGMTSIRAYGKHQMFLNKNFENINTYHKAWMIMRHCFRWVQFRTELLGMSTFVIVSIICVILCYYFDYKDLIGISLAISVSYHIPRHLDLTMRVFIIFYNSHFLKVGSFVENFFVSVERLKYYSNEIPVEKPKKTDYEIPKNWPNNPSIKFENVTMRYRKELPLVLKGINFTIEPQSTIGVVGRTGSGKTSLLSCLFRIVENESGKIFIDNVDVSKIGLDDLRESLAIIPQDPVLFVGTIRQNIDILSVYNDSQIWEALKKSHLIGKVKSLDDKVEEGGSNFSVGERQLLCLTRVLLKRTKILVLDECTSSVDLKTNSLVQNTIEKHFKNCTILIVAHRLNTVIGSDKILLINDGVVAEFDTPYNLITKEKYSMFNNLIDNTGENNAQYLRDLIIDKFNSSKEQVVKIDVK